MKKFLTLVLVCCLVFSSSSTVFATATQWDTSDQANLRYIYQSVTSGGSLYNLVNNIYSRLGTISNTLTDIKSYLFDSNHSVAYWVHAINSWMQPLYTAISSIPTNHEEIKRLLGYVSSQDGVEVIDPYLAYQSKGVAQWVSEIPDYFTIKSYPTYYQNNPNTAIRYYYYNGDTVQVDTFTPASTPILGALWYHLWGINRTVANIAEVFLRHATNSQSYTNWGNLQTNSFTPISAVDGLYKWLYNIQNPVARLSYVLASDERIAAQEKAAENEQAVVDNFIDSSGSGAASKSDFGSVSNLSSGFKNNISTDASVSGIWNIFNADNFGWFSQETTDQLDTSGSGNRTLRSSGSYPTPLLDKQTEDILKYIGGDNND